MSAKTHVDITNMSGNGGGEGGEPVNYNFTSSDESIAIEKSGNDVDLTDNLQFTSSDESISIERNDNEVDFKNNIEIEIESDVPEVLSVDTSLSDENKFLLHPYKVEEEYDGYESKLDKKLFNHSYYNVIVLGECFATAKDANDYLMQLDGQFYPIQGQMMQYADIGGEKHIVRYTGSCIIRRDGVKQAWGDVVWDDANKCYITFQKETSTTLHLAFCHSAYWNLKNIGTQNKYWRLSACNSNVGAIVMSGNKSNMFVLSTDAFETYSVKTCREGYHYKLESYEEDGNSMVLDVVRYANQSNADIYMDYITEGGNVTLNNTLNSELIAKLPVGTSVYNVVDASLMNGNKVILWYATESDCRLSILSEEHITTINIPHPVSLVNVYKNENETTSTRKVYEVCLYDGAYHRQDYSYCYELVSDQAIDDGEWFANGYTEYTDSHMVMWTEFGVVDLHHHNVYINGSEVLLPFVLSETEQMTTMCRNANTIMVVTGNHQESSQYKGNYGFVISLQTKKVINDDKWEEVPQIPDGIEGILYVKDNKVSQCELGEDIYFDQDGKLQIKSSDRYKEYASYRMISEGTQSYESVWCDLPYSQISVGTPVYDAEVSPRNQVGTIAQIGSLHNPYSIVVTIDMESETYTFQTSLTPVSLATTKAIVNGIKQCVTKTETHPLSLNIHQSSGNWVVDNMNEVYDILSSMLAGDRIFVTLQPSNSATPDDFITQSELYLTSQTTFSILFVSYHPLRAGKFVVNFDFVTPTNVSISFTNN